MPITDYRLVYKPFEYPEAFEYYKKQQRAHWLADEVPLASDLNDWYFNLSESEKNLITNILKAFTQTELHVNDYWSTRVSKWFPKPEIVMMSRCFSDFENIHAEAYARLNDELGLDNFAEFLDEPTANAKITRLLDIPEKTLEEQALSLAIFSAFTEGVNLFSSFAILMSFQLRNMLKGTGQIVEWSVKDECHSPDTEVLTNKGWIRFDCLSDDAILAQYNVDTSEISFVKPSRILRQHYAGNMIKFGGEKLPFKANVTENHDMVAKYDYQLKYSKIKAKNLKINTKQLIPTSGYKKYGSTNLTTLERFRIAVQADGFISDRYTGIRCGTIPIKFAFAKTRKIERLTQILDDLRFSYKVESRKGSGNKKNQTIFNVNVPIEHAVDKTFNWVSLETISSEWVRDFVEELVLWDGSIPKDDAKYYYYSTINKENIDVIQSICALGGYTATTSKQVDNRSDKFNDIYRIYIHKRDYKRLGTVTKTTYTYEGMVYCATVPDGALITRYNDSVAITGNCLHSEAGCWLFRQLLSEHPELDTPKLVEKIYEACRISVNLEFDFIAKAFEMGDIQNLSEKQMRNFIKARANNKLEELGYQPLYDDVDTVLLREMDWFAHLTSGNTHQDFFANRVVAYSKSVANWEDI